MIEKAARDGLSLANQSEVQEAAAKVTAELNAHKQSAAKLAAEMRAAQEAGDTQLMERLREETQALSEALKEAEDSLLKKISSYALSWQKPVAGEYSLATDVPAGPEGERFIVSAPETPVPSDPFNSYAGYIATRQGSGWSFTACSEGYTTYDQKDNVVKLYSDSGEFVEVARFLGDELVHEDELQKALAEVDYNLKALVAETDAKFTELIQSVQDETAATIAKTAKALEDLIIAVDEKASRASQHNKDQHESFVNEQIAKDAAQDIKIGQNKAQGNANADSISEIEKELKRQADADEQLQANLDEVAAKAAESDSNIIEQTMSAIEDLREESMESDLHNAEVARKATETVRKEAQEGLENLTGIVAENDAKLRMHVGAGFEQASKEREEGFSDAAEQREEGFKQASEQREEGFKQAAEQLDQGLGRERQESERENEALFRTLKELESQLTQALFSWETVDGSSPDFEVCFDSCRTVNFVVTPGDPESGVDMVFRLPTEGIPEYNMDPSNYVSDPESSGLKSGEHWGESCGRCDMDGLTIKIVTTALGGGKVRVTGGENPVNGSMSGYEIDCDEGAIEVVYTSMGWIIAP
jgi:hypothetical protein